MFGQPEPPLILEVAGALHRRWYLEKTLACVPWLSRGERGIAQVQPSNSQANLATTSPLKTFCERGDQGTTVEGARSRFNGKSCRSKSEQAPDACPLIAKVVPYQLMLRRMLEVGVWLWSQLLSRKDCARDHAGVESSAYSAAWRRNGAVFDDVTPSEAVAEIDRHSREAIVPVGDDSFNSLRISGLFRTGDNADFAHAVAALHGLVVHARDAHLDLAPG